MPSVSLSPQQMDIGDVSYCYEGIAGGEKGRRHVLSDLVGWEEGMGSTPT